LEQEQQQQQRLMLLLMLFRGEVKIPRKRKGTPARATPTQARQKYF